MCLFSRLIHSSEIFWKVSKRKRNALLITLKNIFLVENINLHLKTDRSVTMISNHAQPLEGTTQLAKIEQLPASAQSLLVPVDGSTVSNAFPRHSVITHSKLKERPKNEKKNQRVSTNVFDYLNGHMELTSGMINLWLGVSSVDAPSSSMCFIIDTASRRRTFYTCDDSDKLETVALTTPICYLGAASKPEGSRPEPHTVVGELDFWLANAMDRWYLLPFFLWRCWPGFEFWGAPCFICKI